MWQTPAIPEAARAGRRVPVLALAVTMVTVLALIDILAGPQLVILGTLATGPCLAACAGRPRIVLAVGAYVVILTNTASWCPDRIWGSRQHLVFNLFAV